MTRSENKSEFAEMECPDCGMVYTTYIIETHCIFCHNNNLKQKEELNNDEIQSRSF